MRDSNPQEYNTNSLEDYYASNYVLILYNISWNTQIRTEN